jgi:hypothetical protein
MSSAFQRQREAGTGAFGAGGGDRATVGVRDGLRDREAKSEARTVAPRRVGAVKTLEDVWQRDGGNALARVFHGERDGTGGDCSGDSDGTAGRRVLQRVIEQDEQNAPDTASSAAAQAGLEAGLASGTFARQLGERQGPKWYLTVTLGPGRTWIDNYHKVKNHLERISDIDRELLRRQRAHQRRRKRKT